MSVDSGQERTLAIRLTPEGRGAVASVAVVGSLSILDSFFRARNGRRVLEQPLNAIRFGSWTGADGIEEDVVVCRVAADRVEIHCHGGRTAVSRILHGLTSQRDCEIVDALPQANTLDELLHEGRQALSRCSTERTAVLLARQLELWPAVHAALLASSPQERQQQVQAMDLWAEFGRHLTVPWRIVVCGRPNVGKSSLVNRLLGFERAVVFDQPGTTRDVLLATTALQGWPVELVDTAGQREVDDPLESEGVSRARDAVRSADLAILVYDASAGWTGEDEEVAQTISKPLIVANKIDLPATGSSLLSGALGVSATSGAGMDVLATEVVRRIVPLVPPANQVYPVTARQAAILRRDDW